MFGNKDESNVLKRDLKSVAYTSRPATYVMGQSQGKQQNGAPRSQGEMHWDKNKWSVADWLAFMEGKTDLG
jgi:hypothetical protein